MNEISTFFKTNLHILTVLAVAVAGIPAAAHYGLKHRAVVLSEDYLSKGYGLLAEDTLEPYKKQLSSSERGCKALINTYYQNRNALKLEWAAQACLSHNREIPEVFIGRAASRELSGNDAEAIQILAQVVRKFDKVADIPFKLAQILQRNKRDQEAVKIYLMAAERAPQDLKLSLDILQYASSIGSWADAKVVADRLKTAPTESPEVKLVIARALARGGDVDTARQVLNQAKEMMDKNPSIKPELEKRYPDLLNTRTASNDAESPAQTVVSKNKRVPSSAHQRKQGQS